MSLSRDVKSKQEEKAVGEDRPPRFIHKMLSSFVGKRDESEDA